MYATAYISFRRTLEEECRRGVRQRLRMWHMPEDASISPNTSPTHLFRQSKYASVMTIPMVLCRSNSICTVANVIPAIFSCGVAKCPIGRGEANIMSGEIDG